LVLSLVHVKRYFLGLELWKVGCLLSDFSHSRRHELLKAALRLATSWLNI